jgi:hypothetical protein
MKQVGYLNRNVQENSKQMDILWKIEQNCEEKAGSFGIFKRSMKRIMVIAIGLIYYVFF